MRMLEVRDLNGLIFYPSFRMVGDGLTISSEIITNIFHMRKQELLKLVFMHLSLRFLGHLFDFCELAFDKSINLKTFPDSASSKL